MSFYRSKYKNRRKRCQLLRIVLVICLFTVNFSLTACRGKDAEGENRSFRKFTKEIFCQEVSSNTISIHYTLKNPEDYGIEEADPTFGTLALNAEQRLAAVENLEQAMERFSYAKLNVENQLTYDVLKSYLKGVKEDAEFIMYAEPLGLISGVQTQLPVVLSEYPLECREEIETYLKLLKTTPEYFASVIGFEKRKAEMGLFMSDDAADQVMAQCQAFMNMGEQNYLISTFVERVEKIKELSQKEKSDYIKKNALMINSYVLPSYHKLLAAIEQLKGAGSNEAGLCYYPEGKEYYEYVVQNAVGSRRTVREMQELTKKQMVEDMQGMEQAFAELKQHAGTAETKVEEVRETASLQVTAEVAPNPVSILKTLEKGIEKNFPSPPKTNVQVKYVPKAMQDHLSPAFYMIPAIDDYKNNVIYVNEAHMGNHLTLFTTLAHEGYPGHLYQTTYYAGTNPDPIRNIFQFGGYVEGWATYAEMASYSLAPLKKEQAVILQRNSSMILGMYTLADIGIHYDGWSREELGKFLAGYGLKDRGTANRIYDLILGSPGNYLKYYIGYLEFLELKKEWQQEKAGAFSQKEFHEAVLAVGPAPFELVEEYMWKIR